MRGMINKFKALDGMKKIDVLAGIILGSALLVGIFVWISSNAASFFATLGGALLLGSVIWLVERYCSPSRGR